MSPLSWWGLGFSGSGRCVVQSFPLRAELPSDVAAVVLRAGDLPGQRLGNAWAVPAEAVVARRQSSRSGGRPLGAVRAWREIIGGDVDLGRLGSSQRRAEVFAAT